MILSGLQVAQGEKIPSWYGCSYYEVYSDHIICYPLPFNLIVRWCRNIKWRMKSPSKQADLILQAYQKGRKDEGERMDQRIEKIVRLYHAQT